MTRRDARELAFILLFEKSFRDEPISEILDAAGEARDIKASAFALQLAEGAESHSIAVDTLIADYSQKWSKERISRVAMAILRLAVFEMRYLEDTPESVAINEAVELAKNYGGDEDGAFVNGVLGGISRNAPAVFDDEIIPAAETSD